MGKCKMVENEQKCINTAPLGSERSIFISLSVPEESATEQSGMEMQPQPTNGPEDSRLE